MPMFPAPYVSLTLQRLRRAVNLCCVAVAAALLVQVFVWCMATFTDVRHQTLPEPAQADAIVPSPELKATVTMPIHVVRPDAHAAAATTTTSQQPADPNRVLTVYDTILSRISAIAKAIGVLAMIIAVPLIALGVLVGVSTSTPGVENSLSAFIWSLPLACLTLPIGGAVGLPWDEGALVSYQMMSTQVDLNLGHSEQAWGSPLFYARFAMLPLSCVACLAIIGVRFSSGVSAGIIPKENMRLDPVLEKEAANIKPGSLHSGRTGNALKHAGLNGGSERRPMAVAGSGNGDGSAAEPIRRLI